MARRTDMTLTDGNIRSFWKKVPTRSPDRCWIWLGATNDGYGVLTLSPRNQRLATHVSLVLDGRPRPPAPNNLALHGDCSNPLCVNPLHLRWGSAQENTADCIRLQRTNPLKGEKHFAAKLTDEAVLDIRNSAESGSQLAIKYGVSRGLISMVKSRKVWAHI